MDLGAMALMALQVLAPAIVALLGYLAMKLAQLIRAKVKNAYLRGVLVRLDDAAFTAAKDLQQRVVDEIKATSADGKLSSADKHRIKAAAMVQLRSYLGVKGISMLADVLGLQSGALDGLMSARIESVVHDLRRTAIKEPTRATRRSPPPLPKASAA